MTPYVFKTTDYGRTWTSIAGNLPKGNVNTIRQDPRNRNLLYAAHEFGSIHLAQRRRRLAQVHAGPARGPH